MSSTRSLSAAQAAPAHVRPRRTRKVLREALRFSILEGSFSVVMFALMQTFAGAALMALGSSEKGLAHLAAWAALLGGLAQLASPRLVAGAASRRALVVRCVRAQALACFLFAAAGYLGPAGTAVPVAIAAFALFSVTGSIASGPWVSWMSDLIPPRVRGRYFGWRSRWVSLIQGVIAIPAGLALSAARAQGLAAPWAAFAAIFAVAGASRLVSAGFLTRQHEPPPKERPPAKDFSYWQFLRKARESNFARFALAIAFLNAAAVIVGAFTPALFLRDMKLDYGWYASFSAMSVLSALVFVRFWGRVADRYGNRLVMRVCALGVVLLPLAYLRLLSPWVFVGTYAVGGALWAGLNLASFNYVMEATTPRRRVRCFAYMHVTVGVLSAVYLLAAGEFLPHLPAYFTYRVQTVFALSPLLRLAPALVLAFGIRQLSAKPAARARDVLRELPGIRPAAGFLRYIYRPFRRI